MNHPNPSWLSWPALVTLAVLLAFSTLPVRAESGIGQQPPPFHLTDAEDKPFRFPDQLKGPTIVLFWATWCPYCKALMPHLQSIDLEYGDQIEILAIHFRDDKGDPVGFVRDAGYDFTLLTDGNDVAELNGIWSTPGVLIVDTNRVIRFDLYTVPRREFPESDEAVSHRKKAGYRAPYWAAEIRKSLDIVLNGG